MKNQGNWENILLNLNSSLTENEKSSVFFEKSLYSVAPKLWMLQRAFLQSDRLPSEKEWS
jgi:hypothetical protein